jgi:subtilisin family serine protease
MRYILEFKGQVTMKAMSKLREKEIKILKTLNPDGSLVSIESELSAETIKEVSNATVHEDKYERRIPPDEDLEVDAKLIDSHKEINANKVWQKGHKGIGILVGILDTGVDTNHKCFGKRAEHVWSFNNNFEDLHFHGTHVAGIVGSENEDYTGIAPECMIYDYRVLDSDGSGYTSDIIAAIWQAYEDGCDVINMSLGSDYPSDGKDLLSQQVNKAIDEGMIVVVAAGNNGPHMCGTPACAEKAITVGASMKGFDAMAHFSSYGGNINYQKPELVAPGTGIWSAIPNNKWAAYSGTSMATPHVTGAIALLLDIFELDISTEELKMNLLHCCDFMDAEMREKQGDGKINCEHMLQFIEEPEPPPEEPPPEEPPEEPPDEPPDEPCECPDTVRKCLKCAWRRMKEWKW